MRMNNYAAWIAAVVATFCTVCAFDVGLAWKPSPSVGVTKYNIYWTNSLSSNPAPLTTNWIRVASVPASQLTVRLSGVPLGTNYWFATSANEWEESGPSQVVSLNVTTNIAYPQPPTELTLTNKEGITLIININK